MDPNPNPKRDFWDRNSPRRRSHSAGAGCSCDRERRRGGIGRRAFVSTAAIYGFAFLWLLNFRLRAEYLGENLSESARRKLRREEPASHPSWNVPGLAGPVAAVFEKELHYLSRSGPMMFTLVVPLFMLLVFRSSGQNQGLLATLPG